jgi:type II secretory ATPase GspE/PulE/Tfp pilus assembly ATPase PilB-like protein
VSHRRIGEILLSGRQISAREFHYALMQKAVSGRDERTGAVLVEQGLLDRMALAGALAQQAGWELFTGPYVPEQEAVDRLGMTFLREHSVYPLRQEQGRAFVMPDGYSTKATDALYSCFGRNIRFYIGIEDDVLAAIDGLMVPAAAVEGAPDIRELLNAAARKDATDIHIEPSSSAVNVRFRIDGVLHFHQAFPREEHSRIVNIFFNKAGISAGDFLRFHDGRFEENCGGHKMDVRLSHIPSVNGSSMVLRLLDKSRSAVSLSALGYRQSHLDQIQAAAKRPHGLILFTGPTGCGKTTSLYALLNGLKSLSVKVVTAEDPVEVRLPLVTQVPVDARKEHDFHHITRALLRHDPDIILIGEIRDEKTAKEAVRAAVTGHRVLATLHSNDVVSAILRLKDLGMDYTQISHTLTCVVAQRLVRVICRHCKGKAADEAGLERGCSLCQDGYKGRTVAAEVMMLTEEMRFLIEQGLIQEVSAMYLRSPGRLSMRQDAVMLVEEGCVSIEEVERVFG